MPLHMAIALILPVFLATTPVHASDLASGRGKNLYVQHCLICHGEKGDGQGPAGKALQPAPRDFTTGNFKFKTTAKGLPPSDADILKTIAEGSPGTAMPPWSSALNETQRRDVLAYIKSFNPKLWEVDK
jgi:cytochrome c oxidase cbb3-type subunit I/II